MPIVLILVLVAFQILLVFVHLALYGMLALAFGIGGFWIEIFFLFLAMAFIVMSVLAFRFKYWFVHWAYAASAYWFGLAHFLFMGGMIFFFTAKLLYTSNIYVAPALLGGIPFGIFFLIHLYATWNSDRAEIAKVSIVLPGLPAAWRGKKAVFVSDLHLGAVHGRRFAAKVARKIQALAPEAVFIGGDMYDGVKCDFAGLIEPFRSLHAPLGVYFITGNHDYYVQEPEKVLELIRATGIRILNNEKVDCGGIQLVGVDYKAAHIKADFEKILNAVGVDRSKPSILLKHEPNDIDVPEKAGISLGLFGHTHHGQIFPLSLLVKQIYKGFDFGFKKLGAMQIYTSSGVGTWGPPLRLGTKSEIVLIEFK